MMKSACATLLWWFESFKDITTYISFCLRHNDKRTTENSPSGNNVWSKYLTASVIPRVLSDFTQKNLYQGILKFHKYLLNLFASLASCASINSCLHYWKCFISLLVRTTRLQQTLKELFWKTERENRKWEIFKKLMNRESKSSEFWVNLRVKSSKKVCWQTFTFFFAFFYHQSFARFI